MVTKTRLAARRARSFLQRTSFVFELSADLELGNQAAAGALAFLLSAVPILMLSFGLAGLMLQVFPEEFLEFQTWVTRFLGPVHLPNAIPRLFGSGYNFLGTLATVGWLLVSSTVFFSTIRRAIKVIWGVAEDAPNWKQTLWGAVLEQGFLITLVLILGASEAARSIIAANQKELDPQIYALVSFLVTAVPFLVLWGFFAITLHLFPLTRPSKRITAWYSLVAVVLFTAVVQLLRLVVNTDQYELVYGVITNVVVTLLNVTVFFNLYFLTAAYLFVEQHLDALLFGRYYRNWGKSQLPFPDNVLFRHPKRLWNLYGKTFSDGEELFQAGDQGRTAFFIDQGEVEIVLPKANGEEAHLATLPPGQIFGETASILAEPRSASARAKGQVRVLELPAQVFDFYLRSDRFATKRIIGTLADRLKLANAWKPVDSTPGRTILQNDGF